MENNYQVGEHVLVRGRFAAQYSVRGVVEQHRDAVAGIGVRMPNGNFAWVELGQLRRA